MSVVTATIKMGSELMDPAFELVSIDVTNEMNRIPYAEVVLVDGDFATQKYAVSDTDFFDPGNEIEISLKYENLPADNPVIFKGIVMKHSLKKTGSGCMVYVTMSDSAVKMTTSKKSEIFENITDDALIRKLITDGGAAAGVIDATTVEHKRIVQYYTTNWDMMLSRAEVNGLLVYAVNGKISAKKPKFNTTPDHSFEVGKQDVFDFDVQADARDQFSAVNSKTWDIATNDMAEAVAADDFTLEQGNLKPGIMATALGNAEDNLITAVPVDAKEAKAWADSRMIKTRLSMMRGSFTIAGTGHVVVGNLFELKGVGKKFSGKNLVTGVKQTVTADGWYTTVQFGLSANWFSSAVTLTDTPAAGLLPGVNGLQIGIVQKFEADPEKQARVKVKMPGIDGTVKMLWARMATLDGGDKHGLFFWPEENDEVILGFLNDDPRHPVILGSVYGSKIPPAILREDKNPRKGLITKSGIKILFDDEKKTVLIQTSDNNKILLDEGNKYIEINDVTGNNIKLSEAGISMESKKNIIITAKEDISISGKNITIKGSKIDLE